ncbi:MULTISPECIES: ArsR/SmtB family transcription factor [Amycolatopsis]|uniref:ArsR/SmtB family transcription factor n=1 Tax=Amycolatopsis TaxID=1813 RepID=UPI001E5443E1|nr:winged helix-turn-helix domain-containing protein [Amycolatopsis bullii]
MHFSESDIDRLTVADAADPMWELLTSVYRLQRPEGEQVFGRWRETSRPAVPGSVTRLLDAIPPYGYCPDFLTPSEFGGDLADGLAALARTPESALRGDIAAFAAERNRLPKWLRKIAHGDGHELQTLADTAYEYFRQCIGPHWPTITRAVDRERDRCREALQRGGPHLLLSTLHPDVRWRPPVLEVRFPVEQDLHLRGRGLRLLPSFFCHGMPTTYKDATRSPALVYSIDHQPSPAAIAEPGAALSALLGHTRARILVAVAATECNTSQLAERTNTAIATASSHASILRAGGLIESTRSGKSTVHTITPLGLAVIKAG